MSQQYNNTNSGIISKNDRKEKDTHPDIKGNINIEGTEYWLSGWLKQRKDGSGSFYSLSATAKDQQQAKPAPQPQQGGDMGSIDPNDEIPFAPVRGLI